MGLFVSDWASSFLLTEVIRILISEIIGYHVQILPTVGRSAEGQGEERFFSDSCVSIFVFFHEAEKGMSWAHVLSLKPKK